MTRTHRGSGQFNIINILYLGLIISGGGPTSSYKSVEVFLPSTGSQCELDKLTDWRLWHTMDATTVCGGGRDRDIKTSCLSLTDKGTWEKTILKQDR